MAKKVDFKKNLKIYFRFIARYKGLSLGLIFIVLTIQLLSIISPFLFKELIDRGSDLSTGKITPNDFSETVLVLFFIYVATIIISAILSWLEMHLTVLLEGKINKDIKAKFFNHILRLSHKFHSSHKSGSLISRLVRGAGASERLTDSFIFNFFPTIFKILIVAGSIIYFSWHSALILVIVTLTFIGYSLLIHNAQVKHQNIMNKAEDKEKGFISDALTNIESVKYFGKEETVIKKFKRLFTDSFKKSLKFFRYYNWLDAGQGIILGVGTIAVLYFPIIKFMSGDITIGTLTFIFTTYNRTIGSVFGFVWGIKAYFRALTDLDSLFKYLNVENGIKDKKDAKPAKIRNGEVEFRNITFRYKKNKVFENFNLKIKANEKVALVGHSGSGKSTLVKLLFRFYDPQKGKILIDGEDIKNFKQETLRGEMSVVPQECLLFDDTIWNNIKFSNPDAKDSEVWNAIRFAQLDRFIENLPKKEKTIVGERGVKLSGGEKQRVSIARALLANKKILVLDEATSSLDSKTEYEIQKDLAKLMKGRTVIIIAHRLSTIMKSDRIVVLDNGKIVEMGNHKQLLRKNGHYRRLWELQKGGYIRD